MIATLLASTAKSAPAALTPLLIPGSVASELSFASSILSFRTEIPSLRPHVQVVAASGLGIRSARKQVTFCRSDALTDNLNGHSTPYNVQCYRLTAVCLFCAECAELRLMTRTAVCWPQAVEEALLRRGQGDVLPWYLKGGSVVCLLSLLIHTDSDQDYVQSSCYTL